LGTRGLAIDDFPSVSEAFAAADLVIQDFHAKYPDKVVQHPNVIWPGQPALDQFWFAEFQGTWGCRAVAPPQTKL